MNHVKAYFPLEKELNESYMKVYVKTAKPYRNLNVLTKLRNLDPILYEKWRS